MLDDLFEALFEDVGLGLKSSKRTQIVLRVAFGALGMSLAAVGVWHILFEVEGGLHLRIGAAGMFVLLAAFCFFNVCLLKPWRWPGWLFLASFGLLFVMRIVFGA